MVEGVKGRRSFPDAFEWVAIAAMRGGPSASQVAAEPGLPDRLVRSWLRRVAPRSPAETSSVIGPCLAFATQRSGMTTSPSCGPSTSGTLRPPRRP